MPNASSLQSIIFGGSTVRHSYVERFNIKTIGGSTNTSNLFLNCSSLQSVPLFNTASVTSMLGMFQSCYSIKSIPLFDTTNVISMFQMFSNCFSLESVPLFDTGNVTNMQSMFDGCRSLQSVPFFNTVSVTTMGSMFINCPSLKSVPLFNTVNVTNMGSMFQSCTSINSIPTLSTTAITTSSGTDFGTFTFFCNSLNRCQMVFTRTVSFQACQLSRDALVEIFNNLVDRSSTTSATITITGNWGVTALSAADLQIATNKNWVVIT
jgi:surface protein